ncbi:MAG: NAD(P)/FAD-dependent oxidoreductase [Pseudomonadota bacterium]
MTIHRQRCVVVGAGPAGLSAALWMDKLGVPFVLLEAGAQLGGELARIHLPIRDLLGVQVGDGRDFLRRVQEQLAGKRWDLRFGTAARRVDIRNHRLETSTGCFEAEAILLTMGLRRRRLSIPGAEAFLGRGLSYSATTDLEALTGQPTVVLGGGDGAFENALILADHCPRVWIAHRGPQATARLEFARRASAHPHITIVPDAELSRLLPGPGSLSGVELATPSGVTVIDASWVVVKIGFDPRTEALVDDDLQRDAHGYIVVDRRLRTSADGVFAAGDLCNPHAPSLAAAIGDGAVAAASIHRYLS